MMNSRFFKQWLRDNHTSGFLIQFFDNTYYFWFTELIADRQWIQVHKWGKWVSLLLDFFGIGFQQQILNQDNYVCVFVFKNY